MPGDRKSDDHDETCPWCHGSGREAGHHGLSERKCRPCNGTGEARAPKREEESSWNGTGSSPSQRGPASSAASSPTALSPTTSAAADRDLTAEIVARMVTVGADGWPYLDSMRGLVGAIRVLDEVVSVRASVCAIARAAVEAETEKLRGKLCAAKAAFGFHPDDEGDLAQEISDLRDEGRRYFHDLRRVSDRATAAESRAQAAEAEADRLRKALKEIIEARKVDSRTALWLPEDRMWDIARAALAPKAPEDGEETT